MLTIPATNTTKYPFFDLSEIVAEPDLTFRKYKPLQPVRTGNYLPNFALRSEYANWQHFFNGAETHGVLQLRKLLNSPLVISFYEPEWQQHGITRLKQLNVLQAEVRASGGNLLIVTAKKSKELEKLVWENNLSLNFYFDANHKLAQTFRIYDDADPIWNRFSGIDNNVPLPATYVLDAHRQVIYNQVSFDLREVPSGKDIVSVVYTASLAENLKRSA